MAKVDENFSCPLSAANRVWGSITNIKTSDQTCRTAGYILVAIPMTMSPNNTRARPTQPCQGALASPLVRDPIPVTGTLSKERSSLNWPVTWVGHLLKIKLKVS